MFYVCYKSKEMLLFMPKKDGVCSVWRTTASNFDRSFVSGDTRAVAVIYTPERSSYSAQARCPVLMLASNNAEKHFNNWERDGILLVTSIPTNKEVISMTKVLCDDNITPHPMQYGKRITLE